MCATWFEPITQLSIKHLVDGPGFTMLIEFNFPMDGIFMIHLILLIYNHIMESMVSSFSDGGIDEVIPSIDSSCNQLDNLKQVEDLFHKKMDHPKFD